MSDSHKNPNHRPDGGLEDVDFIQVEFTAKQLGIDLGGGADVQMQLARIADDAAGALRVEACKRALEAGIRLLAARGQCKHGHWEQLLQQHGYTQQRASELMSVAARLAALSAAERHDLLSAAKSKTALIAIAQLDEETISAAAESGELAKLAALPKRQLIAEIRKLRDVAHDKELLADGYKQQIAQLKQQYRAPATTLAPQYSAFRDETVFLTEKMHAQVSRLVAEGHRLLLDREWREKPDASDRMAATSSFIHTLQGAVAPALALLQQLSEIYGSPVTGAVAPGAQYTAEQAAYLQSLRDAALQAAEADLRDARTRAMDANGIRGRRPGSDKAPKA